MHPWIVNRVVFPLHERLKGKRTHARLRELERTQWLEPAALRELQFRRLRAHLGFAYREVPYYTRLLDEHGLPPSRIASFEDFARIPCLTRDILRRHFDDLQPRRRLRGVQRMSTSGSTGSPVTVLVDRERSAFTDASRLRAQRAFGVDMGAREIVLWGSPLELGRQDRVRGVRDRLLNSRLLSAFDLGEAALARDAEILRRVRPRKLYGYASALYVLARYLERTAWTPPAERPRAVFATAEPLDDVQRRTIEGVFGCRVAVEYGCRDAGLIAHECPEGGLHVAAEGIVTEAEAGELVVTNLDSFAMPIIRYRVGDLATLEQAPCRCGRGLPRLGRVEGRRSDLLVTPSGRRMHALAVMYVLREVSAIDEFQVVQERRDRLRVLVVLREPLAAAARAMLVARLVACFDGEASVELEIVDRIVRSASGKHRYVISRLEEAPGGAVEVG